MAYTIKLYDGTTTIDLHDGTTYKVEEGGFTCPPPSRHQAWSGASHFRDGTDLVEQHYNNRTVTVLVQIIGTDEDTLATAIQDVEQMLERAKDYSAYGIGTNVELQYAWDGATTTVYFDVITGSLDLGRFQTIYLDKHHMVRSAIITLTCKPFARGAEVVLSNYLRNPGFELWTGGVPDEWTLQNITATEDTDAADVHQGDSSCILLGAGGAAVSYAWQAINGWNVPLVKIYTFDLWVRIVAGVGAEVQQISIEDGVAETFSGAIPKDGDWHFVTVTRPLNPGATHCHVRIYYDTGASGQQLDVMHVDQGGVWSYADCTPDYFPAAGWVSGRELTNRCDQSAGAGYENFINYLDTYEIPGDVPAALKVYVEEVDATNEMWVMQTTRHDKEELILEAEDRTAEVNVAGNALVWTAPVGVSHGQYLNGAAANAEAGTNYFYFRLSSAVLKRGLYKVLAAVYYSAVDVFTIALGWAYGNISYVPAATEYTSIGGTGFAFIDLGALSIYPFQVPDGEVIGDFDIRIYVKHTDPGAPGSNFRADFLWLVPLDEGMVKVDHTAGTEIVLLDTITARRGVYLLDTTTEEVAAIPEYLGAPDRLSTLPMRIYVLSHDGADIDLTDEFLAHIKYIPRFLTVAGA